MQLSSAHPVHIIGVPLDLGAGRRGVDMGPSALRIAGIGERLAGLGYRVVDKGELTAPIPETKARGEDSKKYIREIARVCQKLYHSALATLDAGAFLSCSVVTTASRPDRSRRLPTTPDAAGNRSVCSGSMPTGT